MNTAKHRTADALPQPSLRGAYATIAASSPRNPLNVMRRLLILFALVAGLVAACALTWSIAWQRGIDELRRNAALRVDRTTSTLKSTLDRYEYLPYLLPRHPFVQDVLVDPNAPNVERANRYLEDLNRHARATVTYIIQPNGLCVAASNWRGPDSFVGAEYQFRPYFIDAVQGMAWAASSGIGTDLARSGLLHLAAGVRRRHAQDCRRGGRETQSRMASRRRCVGAAASSLTITA